MPEHNYKAYGINFSSDFPIPELLPCAEEPANVKITRGKTPEKLADRSSMGALWQADGDRLLLDIREAARFLIVGADEIIVEPYADEITAEIRRFLIGAAFGAILAAKGIVTLKASAVRTKNGAYIFLGDCGTGKSTIAAALLQKGFPLMADDKVCLAPGADKTLAVAPAYPQLRLLRHAAASLDFPVAEDHFAPAFAKFFVPVKDFYEKPAPLRKIYLLAANNKSDLKFAEIKQFPEKYEILNRHVYLSAFVTKPQAKMTYFGVLSQAAKQIPMTIIDRPQATDKLGEIVAKLTEELAQ